MTPKQQAALNTFAPSAVAAERASSVRLGTGYPAEVTIAQWGVETGWSLDGVTGDCNLFGLTSATFPARPKKFCPTQEVLTIAQFATQFALDERASVTKREDLGHGKYRYHLSRWFACFESLTDGVNAYIGVITAPAHRYYGAWKQYVAKQNMDRLMEGIASAGYASGPGYADLLKTIAHQESVRVAVAAARSVVG